MTPQEAYRKAHYAGRRLPELEDLILTDLTYAMFYAEDVIKGRWIEAEDIIINSSRDIFHYSMWVIDGKPPEKMHNMMILYAVKDPNDQWVKEYFEYIK